MGSLRQFLYCGLFSVALVAFLAVPANAENTTTSIIFVEAVPKAESLVSYRIIHLSADGKTRELATSLMDPVDLVQCSDGTAIYMDRKGSIWSLDLQSATSDLLARTTFSSQQETVGRVLLHKEQNRLYVVNNSDPGNLKANNHFQVKVFHFDGRESIIASEYGRAYAIYALSPNVLEVVSDNGLFQVDTLSLKTTRIVPDDSGDLPYLALIRGGYSIFWRDGGKLIQVKEGLFGNTVFRHKVDSGFGLIQDFDDNKKVVLTVVVGHDFESDRLVELFGSDAKREIYRGSGVIGSACYMRKKG
jgi:hypothetical protein